MSLLLALNRFCTIHSSERGIIPPPPHAYPTFFQNCAISPDNDGMAEGWGGGGVEEGGLSFERSKGRGEGAAKIEQV